MAGDLRIMGVIDTSILGCLGEAAAFATLEDVVRWPLGLIADVVVQDEYTHDVIVRGPSPAWVVFDTT